MTSTISGSGSISGKGNIGTAAVVGSPPSSVTFGTFTVMLTLGECEVYNNSVSGNRLTLNVYSGSQANADLLNATLSPANNAYSGRAVNFSNLVSEPAGVSMAFLTGLKTIYASSVESAGMIPGDPPFFARLILTDTTSNGYGVGATVSFTGKMTFV
jgi:hypothetical protein